MRSFEDCFQRLGLARIDILYVHDIGAYQPGAEFSLCGAVAGSLIQLTDDQRTISTSLPCRWRPSLTRCVAAASVRL
jgi:hypothetical protein